MERSLPSMLFLIASVTFSIAFGGWWMQRVAFTPTATRESAAAMLRDADIRSELSTLIATWTAPALEQPATDITVLLDSVVFSSRPGASVMAPIMVRAQRLAIGDTDEPVEISGQELVSIVRDERVADIDPFIVPMETIGTLKTANSVTSWLIRVGAGLGLLTFAIGVFARPERRDVVRGLAEFLLAMAVSILLFGYAIPVHFLTALDNRTWAHVAPQLASRTVPVVLGFAAICAVGGALLLINASNGTKRRQWSTPLSVARYRGGDNPGWG
ncbi:MAG TPA: hypothetical protein VMM60_09875 [Ilumatobacter sp.]|nr:hypothetical protein [Ilumatobacter sp.]